MLTANVSGGPKCITVNRTGCFPSLRRNGNTSTSTFSSNVYRKVMNQSGLFCAWPTIISFTGWPGVMYFLGTRRCAKPCASPWRSALMNSKTSLVLSIPAALHEPGFVLWWVVKVSASRSFT